MTQIQAYSIMFFTGGFLYCCIEIIARGYSHFSMLLAGGTCFLLVGLIEYLLGDSASLLSQMILCGLMITFVELLFVCCQPPDASKRLGLFFTAI